METKRLQHHVTSWTENTRILTDCVQKISWTLHIIKWEVTLSPTIDDSRDFSLQLSYAPNIYLIAPNNK